MSVECAVYTAEAEVHLNGAVIDRIRCTDDEIRKAWIVPARDQPNRLEITSSATVKPSPDDRRDLGLRLTGYGWEPVR